MVNYNNSVIYKICCNDTDITEIYIGSTTNFRHRKNKHKATCNNENNKAYNTPVYQFIRANGGWSAWNMIQVEQYEAKDKRSLEARERYWIETLKPSLNRIIPTRTHREWCDENIEALKQYREKWREDNKEVISVKKKQQYQDNREAIKQRSKQRYQNNKDKIAAKIECDCGAVVNKYCLSRHTRTTKHQFYQQTYDFINF